jgi:hypothetical protein
MMVAALLGLVLLAAGCSGGSGGPGVAAIGSIPSAGPSSSPSAGQGIRAFSECMRAHGIKDFPDPDSGGGIDIHGQPGSDLDPNNPLFRSAQRACQSLMPTPTAEQQQEFMQQALKFSQCMRAHGISDFPDPKSHGGGIEIGVQKGSGTDLNPNNPLFRSAQEACKHYLPGGGKGMQVQKRGNP